MSLSVAGVWAVGVWDQTVWADGVWREGDGAEVVVTTKGGAAAVEAEIRKRHQQAVRKRRQLHLNEKTVEPMEFDLLVDDGESVEIAGKEVIVSNVPRPPTVKSFAVPLKEIKDDVVREIAQLARIQLTKVHNKKVAAFEEKMRRMEEEMVVLLVLTADEDIEIIHLR